MEKLADLLESVPPICTAPGCGAPRAEPFLHRSVRYCVKHLVLSLEAENKVLLDKVTSTNALVSRLRLESLDLRRACDRDAFVATLVRDREDAVRALEMERRKRRNAEAGHKSGRLMSDADEI